MDGDTPTWTLVGHVGIIGHNRVLVSLADQHSINGCVKKNNRLSLNLVRESMLPAVDIAGSVNGAQKSKAELFSYQLGALGTPIIDEAPLTMECEVADVYRTEGFESFICTIAGTYAEEDCLDKHDKLDYRQLKPVLFQFPSYEYIQTGEIIGKCLSFQKTKSKHC